MPDVEAIDSETGSPHARTTRSPHVRPRALRACAPPRERALPAFRNFFRFSHAFRALSAHAFRTHALVRPIRLDVRAAPGKEAIVRDFPFRVPFRVDWHCGLGKAPRPERNRGGGRLILHQG